MEYNIFRPLTKEEKVSVTELKRGSIRSGDTSALNLFLKDLSDTKLKYDKKFKPFDSYCARMDFEEMMKKKMFEITTSLNPDDSSSIIDIGDLNQYGDSTRFKYVGKKEIIQDKLLDGMRQPVITGYRYNFLGKIKNNRLSITVPKDEVKKYDIWIAETYSDKEEMTEEDKKINHIDEEKSEVVVEETETEKKEE